MGKFSDWILYKEGKSDKNKKDFISGKTDVIKISANAPVSIGHQTHVSGTGVHNTSPRKERTRQGKKLKWKKDQEI
jgi:hypothetical protein